MSTPEPTTLSGENVPESGYDAPSEHEQAETPNETETANAEAQLETMDAGEAEAAAPAKKKRERKEPVALQREPGKSLLPFARVQKIIKADKEIPIVAKEATFLISLATEEFIKRLCAAGQSVASREGRTTVQHRDIATVVRKVEEFLFLEDIMPWTTSDPVPKRINRLNDVIGIKSAPTMLDQFVTTSNEMSEENEDVVMNEDGTMFAAVTPEAS